MLLIGSSMNIIPCAKKSTTFKGRHLLQVDSIVKVAQRTMQPKELVEAERDLLVGSNSEARSAYLQQFVDSLHYLKEHGITSTAKQAVNSILRRVDEGQCLPAGKGGERLPITQDAQDTWSKLASLPPGDPSFPIPPPRPIPPFLSPTLLSHKVLRPATTASHGCTGLSILHVLHASQGGQDQPCVLFVSVRMAVAC